MATPSKDATSSVSPVHVEGASVNLTQHKASHSQLPSNSGSSAPVSTIINNIQELGQDHFIQGSLLGVLSRNFMSTVKLTGNALFKALPSALYKRLTVGNPIFIFPKFVAALIGGPLYLGSILASVAIKAVIWIPVILVTAAGAGFCGAIAYLCTLGDKEAAKKGFKFGANVFGGIASSIAGVVAAATAFVRFPLNVVAALGMGLLDISSKNKKVEKENDMRIIILNAAMLTAVQDSYTLWCMGTDSALNLAIPRSDEYTDKTTEEDKQKYIDKFKTLIENGANIYGINLFEEYTLKDDRRPNKFLQDIGVYKFLEKPLDLFQS